MGLRIRTSNNDKGYYPFWYIRYKGEGGKYIEKMTDIPIQGNPPASFRISDTGSPLYEKSKGIAEAYLAKFLSDRKAKGAAQGLAKQIYEDKTGRKLEDVTVASLYDKWLHFSRPREVSEGRKTLTRATFKAFSDFLAGHPDKKVRSIKFLYEVTQEVAEEFIASFKGKLTASTIRDYRTLLSGCFSRLLVEGLPNPFKYIKVGDGTTDSSKIHKKPLTGAELAALYKTAKESPCNFIYDITVCAANTGLRIGDVCQLKWVDVYLDGTPHISTITGKTGTLVHIPIFPDLQKVLESRLAEKGKSDTYVFPEAATMYQHNPSGITYRGKRLFAQALFPNVDLTEGATDVIDGEPKPPMSEAEVLAAIDANPKFFNGKRGHLKDVYLRYTHGQSYTTIEKECGYSRSRISDYLAEIEDITGTLIRPLHLKKATRERLKKTRVRHKSGKNAVSVYGWHSLRANFCVQAIFHNIPEPLIIAVVGHSTFKTTKNYINPTWEVFEDQWRKNSGTSAIPGLSAPKTDTPALAPMNKAQAMQALMQTLTPEQMQLFRAVGVNPALS